MALELAVFDVAGTTVVDDDRVAENLCLALADVGVHAARADGARVMGLSKPVALEVLCKGQVDPAVLGEVVDAAHRVFVERMVHHYLTAPGVRPVPGTETTFHVLREEGVAVALDTGFSRRILNAILLRLGWFEDVVDCTVASDEVEGGRPHSFMIERAMLLTGVRSARRVLKVGDTAADMEEGKNAGAALVVGVLSGTGSRAGLERAGADHVIADVSLLPQLIFGSPPREQGSLLCDRPFGA